MLRRFSEHNWRDAHAPLLTRLVALNHERAAEEKRGLIRWLRPDYQNPTKTTDGHPSSQSFAGTSRPPLQENLPEQVAIIRKLIGTGDKSVVASLARNLRPLLRPLARLENQRDTIVFFMLG